MTSVLRFLDGSQSDDTLDPASSWFSDIAHSLEHAPERWVAAISRVGRLSDAQGWSLLSWIEVSASHVVRRESPEGLVTACFAMSLVLQSNLDRRDCSIVASLLRRASVLAQLDFMAAVTHCDQAGPFAHEAREMLLAAPAKTPETHVESGAAETFAFTRVGPTFDVQDLERWLEQDGS